MSMSNLIYVRLAWPHPRDSSTFQLRFDRREHWVSAMWPDPLLGDTQRRMPLCHALPKACFARYFALVPSAIVRCRWKLLPRRVDTRQALARGLCSAKLSSSTFTSACNVTTSLALSQAEMHCPQDLKFGHQSVGLAVQKTGLMCRKASTRHAWCPLSGDAHVHVQRFRCRRESDLQDIGNTCRASGKPSHLDAPWPKCLRLCGA